MKPLWQWSASELLAAYRDRRLSPVAVLEVVRGRIAALNPRLNALISEDPGALAAARASEVRYREGRAGLLDGVPYSVKDNIPVAGLPCTWGSRLYADRVMGHDETAVARLRNQGAVLLGKTNCPEFTLEGYTGNRLFGVTRNPWNPALTPGGSSGGAVAAVSASMGPLALGTDGGGSTRRPASHTGLLGLKPSIGRIPRHHGLPAILLDFEVVGLFAREAADLRLLAQTLMGPDPHDQRSRRCWSAVPPTPAPFQPRRILYVPRFGEAPVDPAVAASVAAAARQLAALGHQVEEGVFPLSLAALDEFWPLFGQVGLAHLLGGEPRAATLVAPRFLEMAEQGSRVPAERYLAALLWVEGFRQAMAAVFRDIDLIMTPSAAALPWPAAEPYPPLIAGTPVGPRGHAVFTGWVNACGHPGINIPCAPSSTGLPIGFQLVGDFGQDGLLLDTAQQYQQAHPWGSCWSPEMENP